MKAFGKNPHPSPPRTNPPSVRHPDCGGCEVKSCCWKWQGGASLFLRALVDLTLSWFAFPLDHGSSFSLRFLFCSVTRSDGLPAAHQAGALPAGIRSVDKKKKIDPFYQLGTLYISNWLYFLFLNCIVQFILICMDSLVILNFLF